MPARLRILSDDTLAEVLGRIDSAVERGELAAAEDLRAAVKHFLAVLGMQAPGKSVEVRVPPYAAVQCIEGARHTRGTPPAVVETDVRTWLALARGELSFAAALAQGAVRASGERSNMSAHLPLT